MSRHWGRIWEHPCFPSLQMGKEESGLAAGHETSFFFPIAPRGGSRQAVSHRSPIHRWFLVDRWHVPSHGSRRTSKMLMKLHSQDNTVALESQTFRHDVSSFPLPLFLYRVCTIGPPCNRRCSSNTSTSTSSSIRNPPIISRGPRAWQ